METSQPIPLKPLLRRPVCRPVSWDYSKSIEYDLGRTPIFLSSHDRLSGVYLLSKAGKFYIGQSRNILARVFDHLTNPRCCHFTAPHGILVATIPHRKDRFIAEARFIGAALNLGLPLTNTLHNETRRKLSSLPDLNIEQAILKERISLLEARVV